MFQANSAVASNPKLQEIAPASERSLKPKKAKKTIEKALPDFVWDDFVSADEDEKGKGGRKGDERLLELALPCYHKNDLSKKILRCPGMKPKPGKEDACDQTWAWPRNKSRIYKHASDCEHLSRELREVVNAVMAEDSLSVKVSRTQNQLNFQPKSSPSTPESGTPTPATTESTKRITPSSQPSVLSLSRKAKIEAITAQLDLDIVKWICVAGIPPSKVDLPQWKTLWEHANPLYTPASSTKIEDVQIPKEAGHVRTINIQHLRTCIDLSITFDGNSTKLPQSVYTIHIITPARRVCLFEGNEASGVSHTGEHLFNILSQVSNLCFRLRKVLTCDYSLQIIEQVGPKRFTGICSDDTGNTRVAREKVQEKYPWILNMPDPCHRMNLLVKDICRLPQFTQVVHIHLTK